MLAARCNAPAPSQPQRNHVPARRAAQRAARCRADGGGSAGGGGSSGGGECSSELPPELQGLEVSPDGKELIGAPGFTCATLRAACTAPACATDGGPPTPAAPSCLPPPAVPLPSSLISEKQIIFSTLRADTRTGKVVNEFGATRFDVAVRAMRGEFDPPQFVPDNERSPSVLLDRWVGGASALAWLACCCSCCCCSGVHALGKGG